MGFATPYETWVAPMMREGVIFGPMVCFWFSLQYVFTKKLPVWVPNWKRLSTAQKEDLIVRSCSVVNGCLMSVSAVLFLANLVKNNGVLPSDMYATVPYYRFSRVAISAYFLWDIFVCFYYNWSVAWKVHGFFSFVGTYTLLFPFAECYAGYYTGCFELSNGFLHVATMLRTLSSTADPVTQQPLIDNLESRATVCEYVFGGLFALIRVVGGTYVTGSWLYNMASAWWSDYTHGAEAGYTAKLHSNSAATVAVTALSVLQLLQYYWFAEIVKKVTGSGGGDEEKATAPSVEAKKKEQ